MTNDLKVQNAKGSALAPDKSKLGHRGSPAAAPAPLTQLSTCGYYPGLAGDASESMRELMHSRLRGPLATSEVLMIDWTVVGADYNEESGAMHLTMRSGELISVQPSLECRRGMAVFNDTTREFLPVNAALELAAGRLLLMNTDDFDELVQSLDVWRFLERGRSSLAH